VLIPRENIIVFCENLKLNINIRRIIVIDFIILKLFGVCPVIFFPSSKIGFFM
jgi:hypothetical protein